MAQIIKKKIKRSVPLFLIFTLVFGTMAAGLVFNFDFNFHDIVVKKTIFNMPEAQAQDIATTSVSVRNAPPTFFVGTHPYEDPSSTSTTPINNGGTMTFKATGDDPEGAQYYLAVCGTPEITPAQNAAPTCDVQTFCVSAATNDEVEASCTSGAITNAAETDEWYAFVCDGHGQDPDCSAVSQGQAPGVGDNSSPFYINHGPVIDLTDATVDYLEAGEQFTFTATSTDTDIERGGDLIHMYVCDNAGFDTLTGCAGTKFCNASSTASGANPLQISCEWTSSIPTVDTSYNYYVYIMDEFYATSTNNGTSSTYTIINSRPTIDGGQINLVSNDITETLIQLNIKGNTTTVIASTSVNEVYDKNGCSDIVGATSTIYWESASGGYACTADDDDCYQIANTSCVVSDCAGVGDAYATVVCTTDMEFHAIPTDPSSNEAATTWLAAIFAYDEVGATPATTSVGTDVKTNTALDVLEDEIAYGTVTSGSNTGTSTATTTIENYGNSPLDVYLHGTDMTKAPDSIGIEEQKHDLLYQFDYDLTGTEATSTASVDLEDLNAERPSTGNLDITDNVYWGIAIPLGTPSGDYYGENTFTAAIDPTGNWN